MRRPLGSGNALASNQLKVQCGLITKSPPAGSTFMVVKKRASAQHVRFSNLCGPRISVGLQEIHPFFPLASDRNGSKAGLSR